MNRSKTHLEKLDNLKNDEFSFIIMDEIFSSTNPHEGIFGAYASTQINYRHSKTQYQSLLHIIHI